MLLVVTDMLTVRIRMQSRAFDGLTLHPTPTYSNSKYYKKYKVFDNKLVSHPVTLYYNGVNS